MGYRLLAWARAANAPDPASRHLLLVLASYANPNGECWPSFDTLVRDTGYHRATVIRKLTVLADLGLITRAKRVGSHGQTTNTYRLLGVAQCDPDTVFGVAQDASRGRTVRPEPNELKNPLPLGWIPNEVALREMKERYPELDLNVSTDRFTAHFTFKRDAFTDDGWIQRWKKWIDEDGDHLKRPKRTATRLTRAEQTKRDNRRRADETRAFFASLPNDVAK